MLVAAAILASVLAPSAFGLGAGGVKANSGSGSPRLSADGQVLVFSSYASNLTPERLTSGWTYIRDLDTGEVRHVDGLETSLSGSGRFLAFRWGNVFVRDLQTGTDTLASRADGPNGAPADQQYEFMNPAISADGTIVAFQTTAALDPADTDTMPDIYVRYIPSDTTTLVSRATGAAGIKGNHWSERPAISSDGRFVAFDSRAWNLDPDDTETYHDIYVRDLQTNTTSLASPSMPQADAIYPKISTTGRFVAFQTTADSGFKAIYQRDRQLNTTTLVTGDGNRAPEYPVMSYDGRYVAFQTSAELDPADTDPGVTGELEDVYLWDRQTAAFSLVSRATGPAGSDGYGSSPAISGDGRYVAFGGGGADFSPDDHDNVPDTYVRDLQTHVTSLESRATPGHQRYVRPRGATPLYLPLVPAAEPCTSPNRTHAQPLEFGSCAPVVSSSPNLTVGVGDGDPAFARSVGSVRLAVIVGNPVTQADESDVTITFRLSNVMRRSDLSDYTGELQGRIGIRITDKESGTPPSPAEGTVQDFDLPFTVPCVATVSSLDGGLCQITTTADTVMPGFAPEGGRTVYGLGQLRVYDGGPDEDADTTDDNSLFAVQGVFVP